VPTTTNSSPKTQSIPSLPLFPRPSVMLEPRRQPSTPGGLFVARHCRVDPALADTIAALAGLGLGPEVN
jgi:hypothetical protein